MIEYTEYIKENVSIIDIVERAGINLKHNKACCPFHHEKTPSFSVHPKKNIFKCFGCGIGGDVIEFTRMFYNTDFIGAVKILNTEFNLGIEFNKKVSIKPVSYTHLDVYKRQVYDNLGNKKALSDLTDGSKITVFTGSYEPTPLILPVQYLSLIHI